MPKPKVLTRLHVVLAAHITGERLLEYENALALKAHALLRTDQAGEYILEIAELTALGQLQTMLPFWERSGVCSAWWIEE